MRGDRFQVGEKRRRKKCGCTPPLHNMRPWQREKLL